MIIRVSIEFEKSTRKLSGKYKDSLKNLILEIRATKLVDNKVNCKKLIGYPVFRIGTPKIIFGLTNARQHRRVLVVRYPFQVFFFTDS
jgi:hypothetical protein